MELNGFSGQRAEDRRQLAIVQDEVGCHFLGLEDTRELRHSACGKSCRMCFGVRLSTSASKRKAPALAGGTPLLRFATLSSTAPAPQSLYQDIMLRSFLMEVSPRHVALYLVSHLRSKLITGILSRPGVLCFRWQLQPRVPWQAMHLKTRSTLPDCWAKPTKR